MTVGDVTYFLVHAQNHRVSELQSECIFCFVRIVECTWDPSYTYKLSSFALQRLIFYCVYLEFGDIKTLCFTSHPGQGLMQ